MRWTVKTGADVKDPAEQDDLWHDAQLVINGTAVPAFGAEIRGLRVGYAKTGETLIAFAAGGIGAKITGVRSLSQDSRDYAVDPRAYHSVGELDQEWQNLFLERPELRQL